MNFGNKFYFFLIIFFKKNSNFLYTETIHKYIYIRSFIMIKIEKKFHYIWYKV